jgi:hypothetical protein
LNQITSVPQHPSRSPPVSASVSFSGDRNEFRGLVERGAGLELITFGFYRFWLATDIRRHLWSHTFVDGDAPEYTGRGKELLLGFLFALAILVPIYLAYFLIGVEAERFKAFASDFGECSGLSGIYSCHKRRTASLPFTRCVDARGRLHNGLQP